VTFCYYNSEGAFWVLFQIFKELAEVKWALSDTIGRLIGRGHNCMEFGGMYVVAIYLIGMHHIRVVMHLRGAQLIFCPGGNVFSLLGANLSSIARRLEI